MSRKDDQEEVRQAASSGTTAGAAAGPALLPMRARLVVTGVTKTAAGVATLTLSVEYDGTIDEPQRLVKGNAPKGELEIEVDPAYADRIQHGAVFYLVSA